MKWEWEENSWGRQCSQFLPRPIQACKQSCHARHVHVSLGARKGKIMLTKRFAEQWAGIEIHWLPWKVCMQKASVCEGKQRLACVIMSPGWWGHTAPAANPRIHFGWNSNHPERSSMEFHRARGRQINHRGGQAVNHDHSHKEGQEKTATREDGGAADW